MGGIVVLAVLVVACVAAVRQPSGHLLLELAPMAVAARVAVARRFGRRTRIVASTLALASCSAVLVHVTGLIESHFSFLVVIALLSLYREGLPFAPGFAFVVLHHGIVGVFGQLQVLRRIGRDTAQGFLLGVPRPPERWRR